MWGGAHLEQAVKGWGGLGDLELLPEARVNQDAGGGGRCRHWRLLRLPLLLLLPRLRPRLLLGRCRLLLLQLRPRLLLLLLCSRSAARATSSCWLPRLRQQPLADDEGVPELLQAAARGNLVGSKTWVQALLIRGCRCASAAGQRPQGCHVNQHHQQKHTQKTTHLRSTGLPWRGASRGPACRRRAA